MAIKIHDVGEFARIGGKIIPVASLEGSARCFEWEAVRRACVRRKGKARVCRVYGGEEPTGKSSARCME